MLGSKLETMVNPIKNEDANHLGTSISGEGFLLNSSSEKEGMPSLENHEKPKVSTLVFIDLESTGLPYEIGKRNVQITEMCMVAVDRHSFETDDKLRVLNKISLCVRPRSRISPGSMMITGLYSDKLESQEEFDDSIPKLMEYFFRRLQKPICLLAHNGNRFDFPVLQAELNRLNYSLGSDIVCVDTLVAFRAICLLEKQAFSEAARQEVEEKVFHPELVQPDKNTSISDEEIESLLSQDLESFTSIDDVLISVDEKVLEPGLTEILATGNTPEIHTTLEKKPVFKEFLSPSQNEKTPQKSNVASNLNSKMKGRKRKVTDPTFLPKNQYQYNKKKIIPVKRNLFPEQGHQTPLDIHKITRFSLENLYDHFFHDTPSNSHYAEVDCISLSKVCQKISKDFLKWVDENNVAFSSIDALW